MDGGNGHRNEISPFVADRDVMLTIVQEAMKQAKFYATLVDLITNKD